MPDLPSTFRFDLVEEPWIPVQTVQGDRREASLRELLTEPSRFSGISASNPVEFFALHRLLLAICHRAVGPGGAEQRDRLLDHWPASAVLEYLERWRSRFDLFDASRPFMQVPGIASVESLTPKPWTQLALDRSSGNTKLLFDHSLDDAPGVIGPGEAARILLAHLQFTPGGLVKALRTSGTQGPACAIQLVMPLGRDLHETLALGLIPQTQSEFDSDLPPWEREPPAIESLKAPPPMIAKGPAQRYTWLSRTVALFTDDQGQVRQTMYAEGLELHDDPVPDPMSALVRGKEARHPVYLDPDRAFWRDLHALTGEGGSAPPRIIEHAVALKVGRDDYAPIDLAAGGLIPAKAKIVLWRMEERRVAPALLQAGSSAATMVDAAIKSAQEVGQSLYGALMGLGREWISLGSDRKPADSDVKELVSELNALPRYWSDLEARFWALVGQLGRGLPADQCMAAWQQGVRASVLDSWTTAVKFLGDDARALAAQAKAGKHLRFALARATKP